MGKVLYILVLAATFISCSRQEINTEFDVPVGFGISGEWNDVTKAYDDKSDVGDPSVTDFYNGDIVYIFGYHIPNGERIDNLTPNFMYNQELVCTKPADKSATWNYSPIKYWPNNSGDKLSFYGFFPASESIAVSAPDVAGSPVLSYSISDLDNASTDFLYAETLDKQKPAVEETINLVFRHLMGKVQFFVSVLPPDGLLDEDDRQIEYNEGLYSIYVKSVSFEINKEGSFGYTYNSSNKPVWNITADKTKILKHTIDGKGVLINEGGKKTTAEGVITLGEYIHDFTSFVLPVTIKKFTIALSKDGVNFTNTTVEFSEEKYINIEAGKVTTINININPNDVKALDITFSIKEWKEREIKPQITIKP